MDRNVLIANEGFILEVKSDGEDKKYYIKGLISTTDPDKVNDIVSDSCQDDMVHQLKSSAITMDLDHESFRDNTSGEMHNRFQNKIPVAKIVSAHRVDNGTEVKAELNSAHPMFDNILKSIQNGYLHSFSIAFKPIKAINKIINNVKHRILDQVSLLNVGITGIPINSNATFSLTTKSFLDKKMEETNLKELETQVSELKSSFESQTAELESIKEELKSAKDELSIKSEELEKAQSELNEMKSQVAEGDEEEQEGDAEVKSKIESLEKGFSELKSVIEELRKSPVNKAQAEIKSEASAKQEITGNVMAYL